MKKVFLIGVALILAGLVKGQDYTISNWLNNKKCATVMTYDDWSPGHGPIGVPNLVSRGLVGTFFVTTNNTWAGWSVMQNNVSNGIEFANHTVSHPDLATQNSSQLTAEIGGAKTEIENNVPGQSVLTLAYPLGSYNQDVLDEVQKEHIAARTVSLPWNGLFEYEFANDDEDYFTIPTATVNNSLSVSAFDNYITNGVNNGGMVVFMFHSIYNESVSDSWWDAIHEDYYNQFLDQLVTRLDETWNATFLDAVRYHKERHCASLNTISKSASQWTLQLTDTLSNDAIYSQALTVWLKLEEGDTVTGASQNGSTMEYTYSASGDSIYFNAVPDGGDIVLQGQLVAGTEQDLDSKVIVYPNPSAGKVYINSTLDIQQVKVYNQLGQLVLVGEENMAYIDLSSKSTGIYTAYIYTSQGVVTKRIYNTL